MKTRPAAPVQQIREILIPASPEEICKVLTNIKDWATWHDEITDVTLHNAPQVGDNFTYTYNNTKIKATIQILEAHRQFQFIGKAYGVTALSTWTLKPTDKGILVQNEEQMWGLIPILLKRTFNKNLGTRIERWLQKLQQQVNKNGILEQWKDGNIITGK